MWEIKLEEAGPAALDGALECEIDALDRCARAHAVITQRTPHARWEQSLEALIGSLGGLAARTAAARCELWREDGFDDGVCFGWRERGQRDHLLKVHPVVVRARLPAKT